MAHHANRRPFTPPTRNPTATRVIEVNGAPHFYVAPVGR